MSAPTVRAVEWGHWAITFYHVFEGTREAASFDFQLTFPCGARGPMDGFIGSPERQRYIDACKAWCESGTVPDGAVCDIGQRWLYVPRPFAELEAQS